MKGTFAERPKKPKKPLAPRNTHTGDDEIENKKAKKKAAKLQEARALAAMPSAHLGLPSVGTFSRFNGKFPVRKYIFLFRFGLSC